MEPPEEEIQLFVEEYVHEPRFGGYDFVFVDELSPGQTCSICLVAMRNPVQTKCGHRFCEDCLLGTFRQGHDQACPQDRNPIPEEGGFFRDVAWEREILSLRVKCKKIERGCDWTGQLRHYEEHFYECQYEDVVCGDCVREMQRRFLDTHSTSKCCNRIVQCDYCEEEFAFWRTEVHEGEECTRFPLECPQQCGIKEIPREEVESHVKDDCLMTVVVCPYEGAGCTFHDKRINLKAHIEESSEDHLSKTWSELLKAKQELDEVKEIEGHVEEIQGRVERLQSEKEAMKTFLQRNGEEISELKLSEKKLEVENMSMRKEVTELGRQLAKVKSTAAEMKSTAAAQMKSTAAEMKLTAAEVRMTAEEVRMTAATENRSLKGLVQAMQERLVAIEKKEESTKSSEKKHKGTEWKWQPQPMDSSAKSSSYSEAANALREEYYKPAQCHETEKESSKDWQHSRTKDSSAKSSSYGEATKEECYEPVQCNKTERESVKDWQHSRTKDSSAKNNPYGEATKKECCEPAKEKAESFKDWQHL